MVPIYDTDSEEKRWKNNQWKSFEFSEKQELKEKRKKRLWIIFACLLFVLIVTLKVILENRPKWKAEFIARKIVLELNRIKLDSALQHSAFRIHFIANDLIQFKVVRLNDCGEKEGEWVREGVLVEKDDAKQYALLTRAIGDQIGIPGLVDYFCYDSVLGTDPRLNENKVPLGFAVVPVVDLKARRIDRVAVILIKGRQAEISFN